jgi:opacity protein-like surface antigen
MAKKLYILAALLGFSVLAGPVQSAPIVPGSQTATGIEKVQYRGGYGSYGGYRNDGYRNGGYRGGYRGGRNYGRNIGLGIGAAVIGGIILSESARAEHRSEHSSDWGRCAETYKSFESDTGMYTGYDGVRRTCPYLN